MSASIFFFNYFLNLKKNCHMSNPWCDTWHCQWHVARYHYMTRYLVNVIALISTESPYMSICFNLVPIFVYLFQFSPRSICFNFVQIFFYKIEKYCVSLKTKFIIYINVIFIFVIKKWLMLFMTFTINFNINFNT